MRQSLWQCRCLLLGEKTGRTGAGLDVLSHTKKGKFWRDLVGLFPEVIDYLCNPQIDAVKPPTLLLQTVSVIEPSPVVADLFPFCFAESSANWPGRVRACTIQTILLVSACRHCSLQIFSNVHNFHRRQMRSGGRRSGG